MLGFSPLSTTPLSSLAGPASPDVTVGLTGNASAFAVGSLTPLAQSNVALTGNAGTFAVGSLSPGINKTATGNAGTFAVGTLATGISKALTGNAGTFAVGSLAPSINVSLTGNAGTFAAGSVAYTLTPTLTGNAETFAIGILVADTGGVTVALTGNAATFAAGSLTASEAISWTKHGGDDAPKKHESKRRKKIELRKDIEEAWARVTGETAPIEIKGEALELIPADIQHPVEWIAKDFERVQKLLALWERQVLEQDDEDVLMLLM